MAITAHFLHRENVRKARCCRNPLISLVPKVGLEPTRVLARRILNSLSCLKTAWLCGLSGLKWTHPAQTLHKSCTARPASPSRPPSAAGPGARTAS